MSCAAARLSSGEGKYLPHQRHARDGVENVSQRESPRQHARTGRQRCINHSIYVVNARSNRGKREAHKEEGKRS
jgi:hypothetical protein